MVKECGKQCKHYAEEGWNELPMCVHIAVLDKEFKGKYIYDYTGNFPKWCPIAQRKQ